MRSIDEIAELSYESFIESYGRIHDDCQQAKGVGSHSESLSDLPKIFVTCDESGKQQPHTAKSEDFQNNNDVAEDCRKNSFGVTSAGASCDSCSDNSSKSGSNMKKSKLRKISVDKLSSIGVAIQAAVVSKRLKSSSFSEKSPLPKLKQDKRVSKFIRHISPTFPRKRGLSSKSASTDDLSSLKNGERTRLKGRVTSFSIPASRLTNCAHRGFLDCRNKKKQWEKYWCVLHDTCLYCYHTPQSDVARDAILLRGYDVDADVTNLNRSRYVFRLHQQGFPTLYFSSDNHREYLLWVGTLEKETTSVLSSQNSSILKDIPRTRQLTAQESHKANCKLNGDMLLLQKQKLLKELAFQREQIMEEQKLLEGFCSGDSNDKTSFQSSSKKQIIDRFEKEKIKQELKSTEFLTLLNRRRNSYYIKMTQYTKNLTPAPGRRNSETHVQYSMMEKKLKETQEALQLIDREFEEEEATKQHKIEQLERKRDLELLIIEQREAIDIFRRNHSDKTDSYRLLPISMTPTSTRSRDTLRSIDELSDDFLTSSTTSSSSIRNLHQTHDDVSSRSSSSSTNDLSSTPMPSCEHRKITRSSSDPGKDVYSYSSSKKKSDSEEVDSSDEDSGFQPSRGIKIEDSYEFYNSVLKNFFPSANDLENSILFESEDSILDSPSKQSTLKPEAFSSLKTEIDPDVLAKIEDFELFAQMKLDECDKRKRTKTIKL